MHVLIFAYKCTFHLKGGSWLFLLMYMYNKGVNIQIGLN